MQHSHVHLSTHAKCLDVACGHALFAKSTTHDLRIGEHKHLIPGRATHWRDLVLYSCTRSKKIKKLSEALESTQTQQKKNDRVTKH